MSDYSFFDRISMILDMITSSFFFVSLFVIFLLSIIVLIIGTKVNKKITKYTLMGIYALIICFVLYKYGKYAMSFNDTFIEKIFSAMYFPNLITYISMLIISIFIIIINFINKKFSSFFKIVNLLFCGTIWLLFILVLDTVKTNNIDIYDKAAIYSNNSVMILLQASMYIFFIWTGILIVNLIVTKLTKVLDDSQNSEEVNETIDEPKELTAEEYENSFIENQNKYKI